MAYIEKRVRNNQTLFRVRVRLQGFPPVSATFMRLSDAKKWAFETEVKIKSGRYLFEEEKTEHTLAEAIDRYIETVVPHKSQIRRDQIKQLLYWKGVIGPHYLHRIKTAIIVEARDKLAINKTHHDKKRTPATVNRYMAALSHVFTIAYKEWNWIDENPFFKISRLKEPRGRTRYLSDAERNSLIAACQKSHNPYLYPIVMLCILTAARKMEINGLTWDSIDLNRRRIILHETKNGDIRSVPLSQHAYDILKALYDKQQPKPKDLVFPSKKIKDKPIEIKKAWENALENAGIENFRFHDLRHTAASYLAMNGATLSELSEILGHKTLNMVKRYAHLSDSHTAKVIEAMNHKILSLPDNISI